MNHEQARKRFEKLLFPDGEIWSTIAPITWCKDDCACGNCLNRGYEYMQKVGPLKISSYATMTPLTDAKIDEILAPHIEKMERFLLERSSDKGEAVMKAVREVSR